MNYSNQNIAILGAGESGTGAALLAKKYNCEVFVSDLGKIKEKFAEELTNSGIEFEQLQHSNDKILSTDLIIKSPGIPDNSPIVEQARQNRIPVISEIEFAGTFSKGEKIGITGTNGKTTTTMLTYHILKTAGLDVGLAGNVGNSFARELVEKDHTFWVLELSSFQLDGLVNFKNHIAILLNITPDHLDRYQYDVQNYIESKFRIAINQTPEDYFIYNFDDPIIRNQLRKQQMASTCLAFSNHEISEKGAYVKNENLIINMNAHKHLFSWETGDFPLIGTHNKYNTMAASIVANVLDVRKEVIRESLKSFSGIEHRLEPVLTIQGVEYINDSKGTNVNATWYALESMDKPVIWIAGGVDKGNDYTSLVPLVEQKVKHIICLGKDNEKLHKAFHNVTGTMVDTISMVEAVKIAAYLAEEGDAVLLSPACASFDLFENYEDRGKKFKEAIHEL